MLPTLNEGRYLSMTVDSILSADGGPDPQIVIVDDGCTDGCIEPVRAQQHPQVRVVEGGGLGVSGARNRGADELDTDVIVFLDAHCTVGNGWLSSLGAALDDPAVGLVGPAFTRLVAPTPRGCGVRWTDVDLDICWFLAPDRRAPFPVPLTIGACQAFRRNTFEELGRYDEGFTRWGYEDVEICLRAWTAGLEVHVEPTVTVGHNFRDDRDNYTVDEAGVLFNYLRLAYLHFSPTIIREIAARNDGYRPFAEARERLFATEIFDERRSNFERRSRDDLWFFAEINGLLGGDPSHSGPGRRPAFP